MFRENTNLEAVIIDRDNDIDDNNDVETDFSNLDPKSKNLVKAVCLCVCYSANCGGIGTLTGAGPNMIAKGFADKYVFPFYSIIIIIYLFIYYYIFIIIII